MIETIYTQLIEKNNEFGELSELVEVVDENDRPLMVIPVTEVHTQPLRHRVILTLLFDAEGRIYLQRRAQTKKLYPGLWDLSSTGHVLAGESREHAALRELNEELRVFPGKVTHIVTIPATRETDYASITLYSARLGGDLPCPNPVEVSEGMFVDQEELDTMMLNFRELLTPAVIWAVEQNVIFKAPLLLEEDDSEESMPDQELQPPLPTRL